MTAVLDKSESSSSSDDDDSSQQSMTVPTRMSVDEQQELTIHKDDSNNLEVPKRETYAKEKDLSSSKANDDPLKKTNHPVNKKKKKKRGRGEDHVMEMKTQRYHKLVYECEKALTKQMKGCRTFLIQKEIRKKKNDGNSLIPLKQLPLSLAVQQATKQLGLFHAHPNPPLSDQQSKDPSRLPAAVTPIPTTEQGAPGAIRRVTAEPSGTDRPEATNIPNEKGNNEKQEERDEESQQQQQQHWIRLLLQHKQLQPVLEEWNDKITDYRRFCLQLDERHDRFPQDGGGTGVSTKSAKKRLRKKQKQQLGSSSLQQTSSDATTQPTSLFCSLGDDRPQQDGGGGEEYDPDNPMAAYGPAAMEDPFAPKKKNRQGQRARRAKAAAIQAKKQGRRYNHSINWRSNDEKVNNTANGSTSTSNRRPDRNGGGRGGANDSRQQNRDEWGGGGANGSRKPATGGGGTRSSTSAVEDKTHPSWAAKQQQKSGIVAFKGTKITF